MQGFIDERLRSEGIGLVTRERFADLVARLLASGVLWRDHSGPESQLYDDAVQCETLLREWFACAGFALVHDADAGLLRLYPPAARGSGDDAAASGAAQLRARLSPDFVAACLVLRQLYTEGLTGRRELVSHELPVLLRELLQGTEALLGHALAPEPAERRALLRELQRHRILRFQDGEAAGGPDTGLCVLRPVMSFVSDAALEEALRLTDPERPGAMPDSELGALL
jgi:hypothetical protein